MFSPVSNHRPGRRRGRLVAGISIIEVLVAGIVLSVTLTGLIGLFAFALDLTASTDEASIGYNIARRRLEEIRALGFKYAQEGTTIRYYDLNGNNEHVNEDTSTIYQSTVTITSDRFSYNAFSNTFEPADSALRTVVVSVVLFNTGEEVARVATYLARSGI